MASLPISMWATQWFTPTRGTLRYDDRALAAVAPVLRLGPRPGPWEKAMISTSLAETPAFSRALDMVFPIWSEWWRAASLGWMPPSSGTWVVISFARMAPPDVAMPTPRLSAVDSMPRQMRRSNSATF